MLWSEWAEWSKWTMWERMSRISNVVIRVSRMIIVDKVGKSWYIFKCCDQSWCMMCCAVMQNFWESLVTLVQTKISRFCVLAKIKLFRDRCALEMGGLPWVLTQKFDMKFTQPITWSTIMYVHSRDDSNTLTYLVFQPIFIAQFGREIFQKIGFTISSIKIWSNILLKEKTSRGGDKTWEAMIRSILNPTSLSSCKTMF